jgi:type I restriction enzyme S subunit
MRRGAQKNRGAVEVKKGWTTKPLAELCEFQRGLTYAKGDESEASQNVVLRANNIDLATNQLDFSELKYISDSVDVPANKIVRRNCLLICTASGSKIHLGKIAFIDDDYGYAFGGFMGQIIPRPGLLPKFLYYMMITEAYKVFIATLSDGANINNLKFADLGKFAIPFPALPEQQRIVGVLDDAFAKLTTAQANAEKNLQNTRALLESHLQSVFAHRGKGWVEKPLGECFRLKSGDALTSKAMRDGKYPVFGGNGIAGMHDEFNLSGDNVIIGRVGALCGNARHITEKIWLTDNAFRIVDRCFKFDGAFLAYLLNFKNLRSLARQAAQPVISNSSLKELLLAFPGLPEQKKIASELDALSAEIKQLMRLYEQKQATLAALKKALLDQAFTGNLSH